MGTKRVGWARIRSLINENANQLKTKYEQQLSASAATALNAGNSGVIVLMGSGQDITLPTAQAGLSYTFTWAEDNGAASTITATTPNFLAGAIQEHVGAKTHNHHGNGSSNLVLTLGTAIAAGDTVQMHSNGTLWFCTGMVSGAGAQGAVFSNS